MPFTGPRNAFLRAEWRLDAAYDIFRPQAGEDALHVALAVTNGITYLLTWNLKHLANASVRHRIEKVCRDEGYEPTIICTPEELLEEEDHG